MSDSFDYIIIGAGIIGLTTAFELIKKDNSLRIAIFEKEAQVALHASGRNSGVIHAGIYYAEDSLKAQFCLAGNHLLKQYCQQQEIPVNDCGKLIVAKDDSELDGLRHLYQNAQKNEADVHLVDEADVAAIDPLVKTCEQAIWSPGTASINPKAVCLSLQQQLMAAGVSFYFKHEVVSVDQSNNQIITPKARVSFAYLINSAGMYADKIARFYGLARDYQLLPFKGYYLLTAQAQLPLRTHVYPVPDPKFPFLGVHFTLSEECVVKVGPTAVPALWKQHYQGLSDYSFKECVPISAWYLRCLLGNHFGFRSLAVKEAKYLCAKKLLADAALLIKKPLSSGQFKRGRPGIRAQLYDKTKKQLVADFLIKQSNNSWHVLNAVSPAFTCAFSMAKQLVGECYS